MSAGTGETSTNQDTEAQLRENLDRAGLATDPSDREQIEELLPKIASFITEQPAEAGADRNVRLTSPGLAFQTHEVRIVVETALGVNPHAPRTSDEVRTNAYPGTDPEGNTVTITQRLSTTPMGPLVVETISHSASAGPDSDPRNESDAISQVALAWSKSEDPFDVPQTNVY